MVVTNAVDVVEDQTHAPTTPLLVLPAELAHPQSSHTRRARTPAELAHPQSSHTRRARTPAELAHPLLDALGEEPALDVLPGVGGVVDENLTQPESTDRG